LLIPFGGFDAKVFYRNHCARDTCRWSRYGRRHAEYLFVDLGGHTVSAANATGFGPAVANQSFNIRDNIVRVGINYRFRPIVANY